MQTNTRHPRARRGSVLLVSLIFSAIIAISIGSFLQLATNATKISYRTYNLGVAMNIAETGLERAMWSINRDADGTAGAWDNWTLVNAGDDDYRRSFDLGSFQGGATSSTTTPSATSARAPTKQLSSMITGPAWIGSSTPPMPAPPEMWQFLPICAQEPTVAQVSTMVAEST
jgi:hypothetical protein